METTQHPYISRSNLTAESNKEIDFECCICFNPIDLDNVRECLTCEVLLCRENQTCI